MSFRWSNSNADNGILRKHDANEKKDDILVFGYSCKLFRDDEKAIYIDQGKHLIPWMGDDSLKIDRYDCRGNMTQGELSLAEAKVDGVNWFQLLSSEEQRAEKLCDEERYRALYTNEDEEEMYKEEELKRLHMIARGSSYGQVQFNYDSTEGTETQKKIEDIEAEKEDEPFVPIPQLSLPEGMPLPESKKLNAIIEKTATFIANQGAQMEILLKAKQAGNPQFEFLSLECPLHRYYTHILQAIRESRYYPQQKAKTVEKPEEEDHYLHPSLAPVSVESAPSIPSIAYKPSADCAYSMLVSQIKGKDPKQEADVTRSEESDIAPPGTETFPLPKRTQEDEYYNSFSKMTNEQLMSYAAYSFGGTYPDIAKGPVMYNRNNEDQMSNAIETALTTMSTVDTKSSDDFNSNVSSPRSGVAVTTGPLKLIHYSDSDSDSNTGSDFFSFPKKPTVVQPPAEQQLIIDKMASYVAKNGDTFEQIVKAKGDPRFSFLNANHEYYAYYKNKRQFYEGVNRKDCRNDEKLDLNEKSCDGFDSKTKGPVSFSIKKLKEPEAILPKPALPYESSSEEDGSDNSQVSTKTKDEINEKKTNAQTADALQSENIPCFSLQDSIKVDLNNSKSIVTTVNNPVVASTIPVVTKAIQPIVKPVTFATKPVPIIQPMPFLQKSLAVKMASSSIPVSVIDPKTIYHVQNDIQQIEKRPVIDKISASVNKPLERKRSRSIEKKSKRDKMPNYSSEEERRECRRKRRKRRSRTPKRKLYDDVIMVEDDDVTERATFIDLTNEDILGYKKDTYDKSRIEDSDSDDAERKRKAAAFLSSLKGIPTIATQQQSSLASAMVKTLHSYHNKKQEEVEKSRKKKSKRHKRSSRSPSYSSDSDRDERSFGRRHHRRSKHSSKSKRHSRGERSSASGLRNRRSSPRRDQDSSSNDRTGNSNRKKSKITEDGQELDYNPNIKRRNDKLLATSLKELVKETRKDLISSEPIKMAVDIFSDKPVMKLAKETERNSNGSDSESGEITSSSSSSSEDY